MEEQRQNIKIFVVYRRFDRCATTSGAFIFSIIVNLVPVKVKKIFSLMHFQSLEKKLFDVSKSLIDSIKLYEYFSSSSHQELVLANTADVQPDQSFSNSTSIASDNLDRNHLTRCSFSKHLCSFFFRFNFNKWFRKCSLFIFFLI